ncbi:MAG: hypothetical protein AB7S26_37815 [Sandaracinaceae bacterium]
MSADLHCAECGESVARDATDVVGPRCDACGALVPAPPPALFAEPVVVLDRGVLGHRSLRDQDGRRLAVVQPNPQLARWGRRTLALALGATALGGGLVLSAEILAELGVAWLTLLLAPLLLALARRVVIVLSAPPDLFVITPGASAPVVLHVVPRATWGRRVRLVVEDGGGAPVGQLALDRVGASAFLLRASSGYLRIERANARPLEMHRGLVAHAEIRREDGSAVATITPDGLTGGKRLAILDRTACDPRLLLAAALLAGW